MNKLAQHISGMSGLLVAAYLLVIDINFLLWAFFSPPVVFIATLLPNYLGLKIISKVLRFFPKLLTKRFILPLMIFGAIYGVGVCFCAFIIVIFFVGPSQIATDIFMFGREPIEAFKLMLPISLICGIYGMNKVRCHFIEEKFQEDDLDKVDK